MRQFTQPIRTWPSFSAVAARSSGSATTATCVPAVYESYNDVVKLITDHLCPKPSEISERYNFYSAKQAISEKVADFVARLKQLSLHCEFTSVETALRDQMVCGIRNHGTKTELFKEAKLTYDKAIKIALAREKAEKDARSTIKSVKSDDIQKDVHALKSEKFLQRNKEPGNRATTSKTSRDKSSRSTIICYCCAEKGHIGKDCVHHRKTCTRCNRRGQIAAACRSQGIQNITDQDDNSSSSSSSDAESEMSSHIYHLTSAGPTASVNNVDYSDPARMPMYLKVRVNAVSIDMEVDSGSFWSIISDNTRKKKFANVNISKIAYTMNAYNLKVKPVAPWHPASNGAAENFVGTFKDKVHKMLKSGKNLNEAVTKFLFDYRSTEHCSTGRTPAYMMYKRELRTKLDCLQPDVSEQIENAQLRQVFNGSGTRNVKFELTVAKNIMNFYANSTSKVDAERQTLSHFQTRLELLEDYWKTFVARHDELLDLEEQLVNEDYFTKDIYVVTEDNYSVAKALIRDHVATLIPQTSAAPQTKINRAGSSSAQPFVPLPALALPTFSGRQEEWESFKQRFSSLVRDKEAIPRVAKLQHLLNAVQGQAALRLKGLEITAANFEVAWEKLLRRYDNQRIRLYNALENLMQLPLVKSRTADELTNLIDRTEEAVRSLQELQCPVHEYDNWIVHCVVRKLDANSRESWEISREDSSEFPKYHDLIVFLERRVQSLEQARPSAELAAASGQSSPMVRLMTAGGELLSVRALIDPAAERSFVTRRAASQLNLPKRRTSMSIIGLGATVSSRTYTELCLQVLSPKKSEFKLQTSALILSELTDFLPSKRVNFESWPHIRGLELADPRFGVPARVDFVLGGDVFPEIILNGVVKGPAGTPVAQKTVFGWILTGPSLLDTADDGNALWELDDVPSRPHLSEDDRRSEELFVETHQRDSSGRFVVQLPFARRADLSISRYAAQSGLLRMERRFQKDSRLRDVYTEFMNEYIRFGHMECVPPHQLQRPGAYLPHHGVFRADNPKKIRVVFNASSKSSEDFH
ncbi:unnamed protein product [Trichogramma brassicae]|uniref:CCHC-type domain-containing protein n=1 Tax=Trichogramma brassicae TaxID=86971 RepID=A0A6H5IG23_9HYME|nr:unnamed protein product [Trichogramma brassicae]